MNLGKAFLIMTLLPMVFGMIGMGCGYFLAVAVPDYYSAVFPIVANRDLDPSQVDLGLGFAQGMIAGFVAGLALCLAMAWREWNHRQHREVMTTLLRIVDDLDRLRQVPRGGS